MPNVPVPIVGPTYTSRSKPVSAQQTKGFYIEISQVSENISAFQSFPGLKSFATTGNGVNRGSGIFNNTYYTVTGSLLYSVSSAGVATSIGTIPGSGRCKLEEASSSLVITTGTSKPYTYDGTTLTVGTDTDLPLASTSTYIGNRVVYDGNNSDVAFADLGSPLSVDSANITSSDVKPDDILAVYAYKQQMFAFGEESIVPYYPSGAGSPPYDIIQNATQEVGLGAIHSIASNNNGVYFLGSDLMVYRMSGIQPQPIGNPAIGQAIAGYLETSNAIGMCFSFHNQNFYLLSFPAGTSWLFSEGAGWTNLSYGVTDAPSLISSYVYAYGKHLVADRSSGNVYELDFDTFDDNGATIIRQRDTAKLSGKEFGFPGKEIFMDRLELVVEAGIGLLTGQGSNPRIMMSYSDDGGRTWSRERWGYLGAQGDYTQRVEWHDLGSFRERQFRFKVSDPVKVALISANADISVGI
jgi:hypothetical protein